MPTKRNALMVFLLPVLCFLAAPPLGALLGTTPFRLAPTAAILLGFAFFFLTAGAMVRELNAIDSGGAPLVLWHLLVPFYGQYLAFAVVQPRMAEAKAKAGAPAARSAIAYLFLFLYAWASDLNDLAK